MSPFSAIRNDGTWRAIEIQFPDFNVSWAGANPWQEGFCFGSEDGRLRFTAIDGSTGPGSVRVADSGEAINGVAFWNGFMAVSTRNEVVLSNIPRPGDGKPASVVFNGGAHGVVAASSGRFVAPLGPTGLLSIKPELGEYQPFRINRATGKLFNFYKVVSLGSADGKDVLCCATRRHGVTVLAFSSDESSRMERSLTFPGLDVVDVCPLGFTQSPLAAAAVGKDRSMHLIRHVFQDAHPLALRFDGLGGTAYRILSARGHIFILTSEGMCVFPGLARRFLEGDPLQNGLTTNPVLNLTAVDANLAYDRWLMLIMPDSVRAIDLHSLVEDSRSPNYSPANTSASNGLVTQVQSPVSFEPKWEQAENLELTLTAV